MIDLNDIYIKEKVTKRENSRPGLNKVLSCWIRIALGDRDLQKINEVVSRMPKSQERVLDS